MPNIPPVASRIELTTQHCLYRHVTAELTTHSLKESVANRCVPSQVSERVPTPRRDVEPASEDDEGANDTCHVEDVTGIADLSFSIKAPFVEEIASPQVEEPDSADGFQPPGTASRFLWLTNRSNSSARIF